MEIGTEISRKIRVRPASAGAERGGKPGPGGRLPGVTGPVGPACGASSSRPLRAWRRRGLGERGGWWGCGRGSGRREREGRERPLRGSASRPPARRRPGVWASGLRAPSSSLLAPPRPHRAGAAGRAPPGRLRAALGLEVRGPRFSRAPLLFFSRPQSAIKGKLQELGAYVGKFCCCRSPNRI